HGGGDRPCDLLGRRAPRPARVLERGELVEPAGLDRGVERGEPLAVAGPGPGAGGLVAPGGEPGLLRGRLGPGPGGGGGPVAVEPFARGDALDLRAQGLPGAGVAGLDAARHDDGEQVGAEAAAVEVDLADERAARGVELLEARGAHELALRELEHVLLAVDP